MTPKTKKILVISGIVIAVLILLIIIIKKKKSATKKQSTQTGNGSGNGSQASQPQPQQAPQPQPSQASQPAPFDSQNAAFLILNGAMPQTMADAQTVLDNQSSASPAQIAEAEIIVGQQQGYSNLFQS